MSIELSRWRLEKAERTFREGEQLLEAGSYNGAINRFYCYYAAFLTGQGSPRGYFNRYLVAYFI